MSNTSLPSHKRAKLIAEAHGLIQAYKMSGSSPEEAFAQLVTKHTALSHAINPDEKFTHHFAKQIEMEMAKIMPHTDYALPHAESTRIARNILTNRFHDENNIVALLNDPTFRVEVMQATSSAPNMAPLPMGKATEIAGRLVQESDPHGPEGVAHVASNALGQRILHEALAACYVNNGPLSSPLIEGLKPHLPNTSVEMFLAIANEWLEDRYRPAKAVAEAMRFDGVAYQIAAKRADELQQDPAKPAQGFVTRIETERAAPQEIAFDSL